MPFQPMNYAGIAPLRSSTASIAEDLMSGMKTGAMPAQLRRQQEAQELANQIKSMQAGAMPEQLQSQSQGQQLANALKKMQAEYLPGQMKLAQQRGQADIGLREAQSQEIQRKALQEQELNKLLAGEGGGEQQPGAGAPGQLEGALQGMANGEKVIAQGSPNLQHIDRIYDQNAQFREELEKKGFKKKEDVYRDPSTGEMSVTTTYPSGKVTTQTMKDDDRGRLTNQVRSYHQMIVTNVPKVRKTIEALKAAPSPVDFPFYRAGAQAKHKTIITENADTMMKAQGWPLSNESLASAAEMMDRYRGESDKDYRRRLDYISKSLGSSMKNSQKTLRLGADVKRRAAPGEGVKMTSPSGDSYLILPDEVNAAIRAGGRHG